MTQPTQTSVPIVAELELELEEGADGVFRTADESPTPAVGTPTPATDTPPIPAPARPQGGTLVPTDVSVGPGGTLTVSGGKETATSTVPSERMAGDDWQNVFAQIRAEEEGRGGNNSVHVAPGGGLEVRPTSDAAGRPISTVPKVRMAATTAEAEELRRLDPRNVEEWTPVRSAGGRVDGWRFRLKDPFADRYFVFLTFRNPSRRNLWDVSPILPVMDNRLGHGPHMITTTMGSETVPIICGPGGEPAPSLTAVRGVAAKWMAYTAAKLAGRNPGFSL